MKIGILGGTFDPIHNAHIEMAKAAYKQFDLDKVLIMPTPHPPHKDNSKITSNFHRVNMIKAAIDGIEGLEFCDFELSRTTTTYTVDTLRAFKKNNSENDYYFIVGSDSIASFTSWYKPAEILKYATLLTVKREDESASVMEEKVKEIEDTFGVTVGIINIPAMEESSSYIRTSDYSKIKDMVPKAVYKYIVGNNLYADKNVNKAWSLNKIIDDLKNKLKTSRMEHTLGVAQTAKEMAECFGVNPNKAYLTGILHDCAKNLDDNQLYSICVEKNIPVTECENNSRFLLHAKVGEYMAQHNYGISDAEVLSGIRWHTTGKPDMSRLEQIVFCADYIEPGRFKQPNLEYLREIAHKDLDLLTYSILKDTMDYLKNRGGEIDSNTIDAYNYYKEIVRGR